MKKQMGRLVAGATMAAVAAGIAGYSQRADAAVASANVAVSASVAANCLVSANALVFGAYDPLGSHDTNPLDATSTFDVRCTRGVTAQVGLAEGANWDGATRRMQIGATGNFLNYELYSDASHSTVWDDTSNRVSYTATNKSPHTMTIYGRVPGGQDPVAGSYDDVVVVNANF